MWFNLVWTGLNIFLGGENQKVWRWRESNHSVTEKFVFGRREERWVEVKLGKLIVPSLLLSPLITWLLLLLCDFTGNVESQDGTKVGWTGVGDALLIQQTCCSRPLSTVDTNTQWQLCSLPGQLCPTHSEGAEMKLPTGVFYSIEPRQMVLQLTLSLVALFQVISFRELVYMLMLLWWKAWVLLSWSQIKVIKVLVGQLAVKCYSSVQVSQMCGHKSFALTAKLGAWKFYLASCLIWKKKKKRSVLHYTECLCMRGHFGLSVCRDTPTLAAQDVFILR